jgi:hypothetical protein
MTAPTHTSETIARELAALGEAPPSAEELALLASRPGYRADEELDEHDEVASVARLAELSEPFGFDDLSELETHRVWRNVEQRAARAEPGHARRPSGGGPRRWLFAAAGLAAAAAIAWIVVGSPAPEHDADAVADLGTQARATLQMLDDGASDTERAEQLAAEYQQRLEEQGGG